MCICVCPYISNLARGVFPILVLLLPVYAVMGKKAAAVKDQSPAAVAERMISILPKLRLTGVEAVDEDQKAARKRMKSVFQEILEDPTSVLSVSEHLSTRKSSKERAAKEASLHPPMPSVQRIPSEVMVAELANISDLSVDEIAECKEHDSESDKQLLIFATGEPMPLRMSEDMRDKNHFLDGHWSQGLSYGTALDGFQSARSIEARQDQLEVWRIHSSFRWQIVASNHTQERRQGEGGCYGIAQAPLQLSFTPGLGTRNALLTKQRRIKPTPCQLWTNMAQ